MKPRRHKKRDSTAGSAMISVRLQQGGAQFRHGDVWLGFNRRHKETSIPREPAMARRTSLPGRHRRSGARHSAQQRNRKALAHPKVSGGRAPRVPGLNKGDHARSKIQAVASSHDPPPHSVNHSQSLHANESDQLSNALTQPCRCRRSDRSCRALPGLRQSRRTATCVEAHLRVERDP